MNDMGVFVLGSMAAAALMAVWFFIGLSDGVELGREQVYLNEWACQQLPDERVECWEVK